MIGFYNISVILTYVALILSVNGIFFAIQSRPLPALLCLLAAGVCDAFDGKIARATKRSADAKVFGIQIDSLCDLIGFGVLPAVIAYDAGMKGVLGISVLCLFVLAGVIRLAYFNVSEQKRQQETAELRKFYQGLPITAAAFLLPAFYLLRAPLGQAFVPALTVFMLVVGLLFVLNVRVPKIHF